MWDELKKKVQKHGSLNQGYGDSEVSGGMVSFATCSSTLSWQREVAQIMKWRGSISILAERHVQISKIHPKKYKQATVAQYFQCTIIWDALI